MKRCLSCDTAFERNEWRCPSCSWSPERRDGFPTFSPALADENSGFKAEYFEKLASMEEGHFWFESRNKLLLWAMQKHFPRAETFLEIGCGTGFVLAEIHRARPSLEVRGSEIFTAALSFARERMPGVELLQMDATKIPYREELDVIGAFDVIEHIDEDETVLGQVHNALKPGGGVMITVPQHEWLWSAVDDYAFHKRRYTRASLRAKLERAGLEPMLMTSFVSVLFPAMLASRLRFRKEGSFETEDELRINPLMNRTFKAMLGVERALIEKGARLPLGGSLLAIAKRMT